MSEGVVSVNGTGLSNVLLPPVVHDASAAILVVDRTRRVVTYANDLAHELAPGVGLPVSVDEWSEAAGLEDVTGVDLPEGHGVHPEAAMSAGRGQTAQSLLRIAEGHPVTGEAVTAARATAATMEREVLWVLGLPLTEAPEPVASFSLVVFLPARNAQLVAGALQSAISLRDRAIIATKMSFTITDPNLPDNPLVWVNPAFTAMTGYDITEAVGRNCRFLQGAHTDRRVVAQIRRSLEADRTVTATMLNYRKDGSHFWNELSISPVRDAEGRVTHHVGVQADVTARVEAQAERDEALSQVTDAADRLALLSSFTARMATTRQPQQIVRMLARVLVPRVATWAAVYTLDESGRPLAPHVLHERESDPEIAHAVEALRSASPDQLPPGSPIWRVLSGEERELLIEDYDASSPGITGAPDDLMNPLRELGARSVAVVPLRARSGILGCVAALSDEQRPPLTRGEFSLLGDLAVRAGLMLENAQLYARERATAETLQRSLLPRLPSIAGLEIEATYVPAADEAAVGGDWYDVFAVRGSSPSVAVVVGDVMGHNVDSAARMGKLSTIVRAYGWVGSEPFTVLTAVDELLSGTNLDVLATCLYATLTLHGNGATLRYSSAGHPPAILRRPGGTAVTLDDARGPMLGVAGLMKDATRPPDAAIDLARGSTLIFFTDGLAEAYGAEPDLDAGLAALLRLTDDLPPDASPRTIIDTLTQGATRDSDDVAVVALRIV